MENTRRSSKQKWTNRNNHVQHNKYVENQGMKMYCATNQFPELNFLVTHNKPHGVSGLGNHFQMCFYPKLGHGTYAIHRISYACTYCTYSIDQPWIPGFPAQQQLRYQPIKDCIYWPVLGSFNNWNIPKLSYKATSSEEIDKSHQVVLNSISDNMSPLVQTGQYGYINTTDRATMGY